VFETTARPLCVGQLVIHSVVLLALIALVFALGAPGLTPSPVPAAPQNSQLPATLPGLSPDEGVFLVSNGDNGSRVIYFIAQNARHSILESDLRAEQQLNPLWPVRPASPDEVLAFAEGAPVGAAQAGLLKPPAVFAEPAAAPEPAKDAEPAPAPEPAVVAEPASGAPERPLVAEPAPLPEPASALVAAPVDEPLMPVEPSVYVLRPGDNLTRLSARFGTTIDAILAANGLTNANRIFVGQALLIPGSPAAAEPLVEMPEQVVETPAPPAPIAELPSVADLPVADDDLADSAPVADQPTTYVVKRGDSATTIARLFNVDVDALLAANGVQNRNRIYAGQTLAIPG
jgi:LysM repeat protein